jgi:hypothetical protein
MVSLLVGWYSLVLLLYDGLIHWRIAKSMLVPHMFQGRIDSIVDSAGWILVLIIPIGIKVNLVSIV